MAQISLTEERPTMVRIPMREELTSNDAHQKGVTQSLSALANERDPISAYMNSVGIKDEEAQFEAWSNQTKEDRLSTINQQLDFLSPEQIRQDVETLDLDNSSFTPIQGNYRETVKSFPPSIVSSEDDVTREAVYMQMRETMSDHTPRFDEMSVGDIGLNVGGLLIPKRSGAAWSKILSDMGFISGFGERAAVFADPTTSIIKLRNMFWDLDDAGQIEFMDLLAQHLPNASDNAFIRAELVQDILGSNFNKNASHLFQQLDNLDISLLAKIALDAGMSVKKLLKVRKLAGQDKTAAEQAVEEAALEAIRRAGGDEGVSSVVVKTPEKAKAVDLVSKSMAKTGSILNYFKRNDLDAAAEVVTIAKNNPEVTAKVGVSQADIGDAVNPLIHGDVGALLTGVTDDVASGMDHMIALQEAQFRRVTEDSTRLGILDDEGVADVMKAAELEQLRKPGMVEANVEIVDETGFKLSWKEAFRDSIGRLRTRSSEKIVDFTKNDVGELRAPVEEWVSKGPFTLDMNARSTGSIRKWFVTDVEGLARQQEMTAQAFDDMMKAAFKGLDKSVTKTFGIPTGFNAKKSAANVDFALQHGARAGKTYRFDELVNGVTGRDMTTKEARAYIGVRNVVEKLYQLKNKQIVDNLLTDGIKLYDGVSGVLPIRSYESWQAGRTAWKQVGADSHHILAPDGGLTLKGFKSENGLFAFKSKAGFTKEMIQDAYEKGFILARNHSQSGLFRKGDVLTQWGFVKANKVISPRGQQVIHRIEGYMPKQRTNANWFIKKSTNIGLSGAPEHRAFTTKAYADTEEAAIAWKNAQNNPDDFKVMFDREVSATQRMYDTASKSGGMYSGARKSSELPFVGDGDSGFADSFEAMQHYINHIGRQYPASLYRIGAEERLLAYAKDLGVNARGMSLHNVLDHAKIQGISESSDNFKMLKGIQNQLSFVNMIPTASEANMANRWKNIGRFFERDLIKKIPGMDKWPKYFYQKAARNAQPQDIIRGITFHHMLGMYNPAQIIVQYSGALVSFAIDPVGFPKHVAKQVGWTAMDAYASDPLMQKKMVGWYKANDLGDFVDEYQLWAKSGFRESVVQGNADYTSLFTKNLPYNAGLLRSALANHTLFYKMGELANTRVAYATAISRYKKTHGVKHINPNSEEALKEIGVWTERFRLNMSRANQSDLNKGFKAVPFQFQQIISKYFEKVLPKFMGGTDELTSYEKTRLGVIPTVATGLVGVPYGEWAFIKIMDMYGIDEKEFNEEETRTLKHGVIGWASHLFDFNVNFSERMTLGGDVLKNSFEALITAKPTWQWLGGPSANVADRYWRNGQYLAESFDIIDPINKDFSTDDLLALGGILQEVAFDIPTVSRNIKKYSAHILSDNPTFVVDGKKMWDWETMNKRTAVLGIFGFQPSEATDMYEINEELSDSRVKFATFGDTDADVILRILNTKLLNGKAVKDTAMYARINNALLKNYGPTEQMELLTLIRDKTLKRKFDQNNLFYKWMIEDATRVQDDLNVLNATLARKRDERK